MINYYEENLIIFQKLRPKEDFKEVKFFNYFIRKFIVYIIY